ncbi:fasciclin domain-containing protein [Aquimarina sp. RZ0]|uniref:fasciclin domain-containing protein n=1 Tax=Aquimarina sp. RZ0 TaxID=2607730 RepID=UPI0011F0D486|nr:fasciclin domain-containing protein [Aquimarina sp. RZ0]KAA1241571.1 fasciclin domain-containing protein [Aquimarina sp. RZ0]
MRIKTLFNVLVISGSLLLVGCSKTENKNSQADKNKGLIAQANIPSIEEEKMLTVNGVISRDIGFKKLNQAVQATELSTVLNADKVYTIFAPLNGAFERMPKNAFDQLVLPENKETLAAILKCHIIPGVINEEAIIKAIKNGKGSVKLKTLGGSQLIATRKRGKILLIDENGNSGRVMKTDIEATNGVIHTLESVMQPKK